MSAAPRVAITGLGPLTPAAAGCAAFEALLLGQALSPDTPAARPTARGEQAGALRQMDGLSRLAVTAAGLALADAHFVVAEEHREDVALALGTGYGCLASSAEYLEGIQARGTRFGNPIVFQNTVPNAATGYAAIATGIRGPNATFASGRGAGAEALAFGRDELQQGRVRAALVGSADQLSAVARRALALHSPLSARSEAQPFDRRRDGLVPREGACFMLLEELHQALERGAYVYAELVGVGQAGGLDSARPPLARAIQAALDDAGLPAEAVDLVLSGASGSPDGDRHEAAALLGALGAHVPVSCPKALVGETVAGSGPFGLAAAALALAHGRVGPTCGDFEADPECPLCVVVGEPLQRQACLALVPVAGDDGTAHALLVRRYLP